MCSTVVIDEATIETVAELERAVGYQAVPNWSESTLSPNGCLCGVDIQATAESAGWYVSDHDTIFDEWTLRKL